MCMKSVLALSVLASTLFSVAAQADSSSNFLVGLEGGYARHKTNFITGYTAPLLTPPVGVDNQTYMLSDEMLMLGVMGGWQWRCNRTMLGLEGSADFHSFLRSEAFLYAALPHTFEGTAEYDRGPIFTITTRAGYFVTSGFMPYVRVGAQVSRDEGTYQVFANPQNPLVPNFQSDAISSGRQDVWGIVGGIGVEFPAMIGPSTFRAEYTCSRSESIVIDDHILPIIGTDKFRNPQINTIKFAWVWNFI